MLSLKIYLPCNFEVNLITHLGVIALFSSNLKKKAFVIADPFYKKNLGRAFNVSYQNCCKKTYMSMILKI
jgi:hypothetical protein